MSIQFFSATNGNVNRERQPYLGPSCTMKDLKICTLLIAFTTDNNLDTNTLLRCGHLTYTHITNNNLDTHILLRRGHDELAEWMFDQELQEEKQEESKACKPLFLLKSCKGLNACKLLCLLKSCRIKSLNACKLCANECQECMNEKTQVEHYYNKICQVNCDKLY